MMSMQALFESEPIYLEPLDDNYPIVMGEWNFYVWNNETKTSEIISMLITKPGTILRDIKQPGKTMISGKRVR